MIQTKPILSVDFIGLKQAASFRKQLKDAASSKKTLDINFCALVWSAKNTSVMRDNEPIPFYEYCKYNSWNEFSQKELNLTGKTANNYAKVHQAFAVNLGKVEIAKKHILPISKMIALSELVNKNNVDELVEISKEISTEEFKQLTLNTNYKHSLEKNEFVTFFLNKGDKKVIDKAFKKASKKFGYELTNGELIIHIIKDWMSV